MGAPLALGILTWDDVLAGFSASGVCAWVLCLGSVLGFCAGGLLGERQNVSAKPSRNAPQGRKHKGDSGD